jgi:hypothetical protein
MLAFTYEVHRKNQISRHQARKDRADVVVTAFRRRLTLVTCHSFSIAEVSFSNVSNITDSKLLSTYIFICQCEEICCGAQNTERYIL